MNGQIAWSKPVIIALLVAIVLLFYITTVTHFGYTPDDSYIYFQFARNFIHGDGMSFNSGEPTYGFTSPLWVLIISMGGKLGVDIPMAAKALDLVIASAALLAFYFVALELVRDIAVAFCAMVAFSVNAWFLRWASTGMETSLAVLLVLVAFWFLLRNEYMMSTVFAALLTLVRPEAMLFVPLIVIDCVVNSKSRNRGMKMGIALFLVYIAALLPWFLYAYSTFGTVVSNTSRGKSGGFLNFPGIVPTINDTVKTIGSTEAIAILVLLVCGILLFRQRNRSAFSNHNGAGENFYLVRQSAAGLSWIVVIPLTYIAFDVNVVSRYLLLVTPFILLYAYFFLFTVSKRVERLQRWTYGLILGFTALVMIQNQVFYQRKVAPGITAFQQGVEFCLIPIGKWLAENTEPGSTVLAADIGAIGYYSQRTICDAAGLATPEFIPVLRSGHPPYEIIEQKKYRDICLPQYLLHRSPIPEALNDDPDLLPLVSRPFFQMSLTSEEVIYYTLYEVRDGATQKSLTRMQ